MSSKCGSAGLPVVLCRAVSQLSDFELVLQNQPSSEDLFVSQDHQQVCGIEIFLVSNFTLCILESSTF